MKTCTAGALGANRNTHRKVWKPDLRTRHGRTRAGGVKLEQPMFIGEDGGGVGRYAHTHSRQRCSPLGKVIHCGALGTGNVVKLVTNQIWFINAAAIGEALTLNVKGGVEPLTV